MRSSCRVTLMCSDPLGSMVPSDGETTMFSSSSAGSSCLCTCGMCWRESRVKQDKLNESLFTHTHTHTHTHTQTVILNRSGKPSDKFLMENPDSTDTVSVVRGRTPSDGSSLSESESGQPNSWMLSENKRKKKKKRKKEKWKKRSDQLSQHGKIATKNREEYDKTHTNKNSLLIRHAEHWRLLQDTPDLQPLLRHQLLRVLAVHCAKRHKPKAHSAITVRRVCLQDFCNFGSKARKCVLCVDLRTHTQLANFRLAHEEVCHSGGAGAGEDLNGYQVLVGEWVERKNERRKEKRGR